MSHYIKANTKKQVKHALICDKIKMKDKVKKKMNIALITGSSSGIGNEYVKTLALQKKFDEIWIVARRLNALEALQAKYPKQVFRIFCLDLAREDSYLQIEEALKKAKPNISMLINCAGFGKICYFDNSVYQEQLDMIKVNCLALTALTRICLNYMSKQSQIINIASVAAFLPLPKFSVYSATKAYVMYFSRALNRELKSREIHVLSVYPAPVKTDFFPNASKKRIANIYDLMPRIDAKKVVLKSLKAAAKKKEVLVVGYFSDTLRLTAKILPTSICLKVLEKL